MIAFVILFSAALVLPLLWLLAALWRRQERLRLRGAPTGAARAALALTLLALGFQLTVLVPTSHQLFEQRPSFSPLQALALLIAWLALWSRWWMHHQRRHKSRRYS